MKTKFIETFQLFIKVKGNNKSLQKPNI